MIRHIRLFFACMLLCLAANVALGHSAQAVVFPLGGNASFDHVVWYLHGAGYFDQTADAKSVTSNDVPLAAAAGDVLYLGMQSPFDRVYVQMSTVGSANFLGGTVAYEYSTGTNILGSAGFASLAVTSDAATVNFTTVNGSGNVTISFTPPSDWKKSTVNGASAYWVRIKTSTDFATAPVASSLEARAYNVKLQMQGEFIGSWTGITAPVLSACDASGLPAAQMYGEWGAGSGVYYYALNTDGRNCTLVFSSGMYVTASISVTGLNTSLQDLTATPVVRGQNVKVTIYDERGNPLSNAVVTASDGSMLNHVNNVYYGSYAQPVGLQIAASGYVTETGLTGNTGLSSVGPKVGLGIDQLAPTLVSLIAPTNQPCSVVVSEGSTGCAAMRLDTNLHVTTAGNPVSGATVTVYRTGISTIADDQGLVGSLQDAFGVTDASGYARMGLGSGKYDYVVSAPGYTTSTGTFTNVVGALNVVPVALVADVSGIPVVSVVSSSQSSVSVSPSTVVADNVQSAAVTVVVRNAGGIGLSGKTVTLSAAGVANISPSQVTTDASGVAVFSVKSANVGSVVLSAYASGQLITTQPSVQFILVGSCPYATGMRVKLPDDGNLQTQEDSAVYYYATDCKRHAFPNSKVYFTWYPDFSGVTVVSAQVLASMPLGKNVTYRPGVKMVKFTTLNNVYAVSKGGMLRWVTSEAVATALYGSTWNKQIDDISDAFYTDYVMGADILNAGAYSVVTELMNAPTIDANL